MTAYDVMPSIVGSEMCIRARPPNPEKQAKTLYGTQKPGPALFRRKLHFCEKMTKKEGDPKTKKNVRNTSKRPSGHALNFFF